MSSNLLYTETYHDENISITNSCWSNTNSLLACIISSNNETITNSINIYNEDYELQHTLSREYCTVNVVKWHPNRLELAIGWSDGTLWYYYPLTKITKEDLVQHNSNSINFISFSPYGIRLLTGDNQSNMCIWDVSEQANKRTKLQLVCKHDNNIEANHN